MGVTLLKQSQTARPLTFMLISSTDHISALTGATATVTLSKDGAAYGAAAGAVSEVANGLYKVAGNATDTGSLGALWLHATATGADPADKEFRVVAFDPDDAVHLGLSALPNTACTTNASLLTSGTSTDQLSVTSGRIDIGKALGTAITLDANNVLNVSAKYWAGTAITATSIPVATAAGAAGGLLISGSNAGTTTLGALTITGATTFTGSMSGTFPTVTTVTNQLTAAAIATGVWQDTTAGDFTVASSIGKSLYIANVAPGGSGGHLISGSNAGTTTLAALTITGATTFSGAMSGTFPTVTNLTNAPASLVLRSSTATAGASSSITLDAGASTTTDLYTGDWIALTGGTGAGQSRVIIGYSSSRVSTVIPAWTVTPDNTTTFAIHPAGAVVEVLGNIIGNLFGNVIGSVGGTVNGQVTANVTTWAGQTATVDANNTPVVSLAADQPNYAPAVAGDAMTLASGAITAATIAAAALNGKGDWSTATPATAAAIATAVWQDLLSGSDFTVSGSAGKQFVSLTLAAIAAAATGSGTGTVSITSNTGGAGNLTYVNAHGVGVGGATVRIYLSTDWPTNPAAAQAVGSTNADGTWGPLFVDPGTYVAVFDKVGVSGPDASAAFTV